jgi:hypothetical protein
MRLPRPRRGYQRAVARPQMDPNMAPPRGTTDLPGRAEADLLAEAIQSASRPQSVLVNMYEAEGAVVVVAALPGVGADDIEVEVDRSALPSAPTSAASPQSRISSTSGITAHTSGVSSSRRGSRESPRPASATDNSPSGWSAADAAVPPSWCSPPDDVPATAPLSRCLPDGSRGADAPPLHHPFGVAGHLHRPLPRRHPPAPGGGGGGGGRRRRQATGLSGPLRCRAVPRTSSTADGLDG